MSLAELLHAVRVRWIIVLITVVAGLGVAAGVSWRQPERYEAGTQLFVSMTLRGTASSSQLAQGSDFTRERVKSYADIVNSPLVLDAVRERLGLPLTTEELASMIEVSSPLDTVLLDIRVTDTSKERARQIASALGTEFPRFVDRLELPSGAVVSPVKVSVSGPATVRTDPVSPSWPMNLAVGLLLGLVAGIGYAVVRQLTDRTIRSQDQAAQLTEIPVLGAVPADSMMKTRPLIIDDGATPRAEAFRQLRTNIRFLSVDRRLSSFVVTGAMPGEGKTTVAANLAVALARAGQPVVLVDADMRRPRLADTFAIPGGVGLSTVLIDDVSIHEALHQWRSDLPLYLLPAGPAAPNPSELLASNKLRRMLDTLRDSGMIVIFDSPPLLPVTDAAILARETDGAFLVTGIGSTRIDQLTGAVDSIRRAGGAVLGLVANRVTRSRGSASAYYTAYTDAVPAPQHRSEDSSLVTTGRR
ncbi:polysaccharide biosynthesis tyrosine autokinase [Actinoplanes sp. DH11]|uniref:polysaccharide biosynthesis tyrosine autokinase n=1 Tax=Actinoplanes sp. DH11 TaxID=2857011 RepID=UPI001E458335|nr:polysaccharide biosynthesis tyrosine autokinase [Actinoplanes sp. DH11]